MSLCLRRSAEPTLPTRWRQARILGSTSSTATLMGASDTRNHPNGTSLAGVPMWPLSSVDDWGDRV